METDRPTPGLRVLVVDDCEDTCFTVVALLRLWGHDVRVAGDGYAALDAATTFRPEVVLLDIVMPGMNGWEVARRLRAEVGLTDALVAALTGFGQERDHQASREAGCDRHFTKPVDLRELEKFLSDTREQKRCGRKS